MDKFMKKMQRFGGAMFTPTLLFAFAGIKTLDTGMMGALAIAGITIWLHNKYYDKELPDWIGIFRGSSLVVALGFFAMIPAAFITCVVWPHVQDGIRGLQTFSLTLEILVSGVMHFCRRF